jgi:hypothetical protein
VFDVPKILEALLQRLRRLLDAKSGMKFWVDALCINQSDVNGKNHQVKLMQTIYSKAFAVFVWLGDAADDSDKAIEFISSITRFTLAEEGTFDPWDNDISEASALGEELSALPWKALLSFFSRSYWLRLWIIQELALNHNMTLFLCGEQQLSRGMLLRTFGFYQKHSGRIDAINSKNLEVAQWLTAPVYRSIWAIFYQVYCLITTGGQTKEMSILEVVLDLGRKAKATDLRDKMYGILGLLPSSVALGIFLDYSLSQEAVSFQFAKTLLEESRRLEAIISWCSFKRNASLSSWIPDWTTQFTRNHIQWLRKQKAAGIVATEWSISKDNRYLQCRGLIFDSVASLAASLPGSLPYRAEVQKQSLPIIGYASLSHDALSHYGDQNGLHAALWRTLRQDFPFRRDPTRTFFNIPWINWKSCQMNVIGNPNICYGMETITQNVSWEAFEQFRQTNAEFPVFGFKFREFFPGMFREQGMYSGEGQSDRELRQNDDLANQIASDMHVAVLALIGRRLITTTGGYIGLAPEEVLKNNVIAILYGYNFPVVLRPCGEYYYVIGECYIDMDGEVIEAKERGEHQEIEINLC